MRGALRGWKRQGNRFSTATLFLEKTTKTLGEGRHPETQREVDSDTQRKRGRDSERKGDIMGSG